MKLTRSFHGQRDPAGRCSIELDDTLPSTFRHPALALQYAWEWGPGAFLSDLRMLSDALLQEVLEDSLCAGMMPAAELDNLCSDFAEEVIAELPDRWSLWDFEVQGFVVAWLQAKSLWK